jgi:hypothetical protein
MEPPKRVRFLGQSIDPAAYDDDAALAAYIWRHYRHLMSALEIRVGTYSVPIISTSPIEKAQRIHEFLEERDGHVPDEQVVAAFQMSRQDFFRQVMRRLMRDFPGELVINRCPQCNRLTRTPTARRCPWCNHDWH